MTKVVVGSSTIAGPTIKLPGRMSLGLKISVLIGTEPPKKQVRVDEGLAVALAATDVGTGLGRLILAVNQVNPCHVIPKF